MPRAKGGFKTRQRRKKVLKRAEGYWGGRHRLFRTAQEAVDKALVYAYHGRKLRKRDFRSLWIVRINAGARACGLSYSRLMEGLNKAGVEVNRKILAELAVNDQQAFGELANLAKATLG
jgi:large subunit ribosomal protein L20